MAPSGRNWPKLCMEGTNGIRFPGKKNVSHPASDLGFSYSSLYQRFNKMSTSGPNGPRFCMEGINGIRCPGKKIEAIQPLTSNFGFLVSIQICYLMTLGPSNPPKGVLLGLVSHCQQLASISQVERQNSLLALFWRSANF